MHVLAPGPHHISNLHVIQVSDAAHDPPLGDADPAARDLHSPTFPAHLKHFWAIPWVFHGFSDEPGSC